MIDIDDVRPSVKSFAIAMELKLRKNDYKGGWEKCSLHYLMFKIDEEYKELQDAYKDGLDRERRIDSRACLKNESVDVANIAMMLYDNLNRS